MTIHLDTCASDPIFCINSIFSNIDTERVITIQGIASGTITANPGVACLYTTDINGNIGKITIKNALYSPQAKINLLPNPATLHRACNVELGHNNNVLILPVGSDCGEGDGNVTLYHSNLGFPYFKAYDNPPTTPQWSTILTNNAHAARAYATQRTGTERPIVLAALWHARLGCISQERLYNTAKLSPDIRLDRKALKRYNFRSCPHCLMAKAMAIPFNGATAMPARRQLHDNTNDIGYVYMDILSSNYKSIAPSPFYVLVLVDKATRYVHTELLPSKASDHVLRGLQRYLAIHRNVRTIHADNAPEFTHGSTRAFLDNNNIHLQTTTVYAPSQNLTETYNRTLLNITRCLIQRSGVPPRFWAMALQHAATVYNLSWTRATNKIPYKDFYNRTPPHRHIRTFGCIAYAIPHEPMRRKLDTLGYGKFGRRALPGMYLGPSQRQPDDTACIYIRGYGLFDCRNYSTVEDTYYFHSYSENLEALRRIVPHPDDPEATNNAEQRAYPHEDEISAPPTVDAYDWGEDNAMETTPEDISHDTTTTTTNNKDTIASPTIRRVQFIDEVEQLQQQQQQQLKTNGNEVNDTDSSDEEPTHNKAGDDDATTISGGLPQPTTDDKRGSDDAMDNTTPQSPVASHTRSKTTEMSLTDTAYALLTASGIPKTVQEALNNPRWKPPTRKEMDKLIEYHTWEHLPNFRPDKLIHIIIELAFLFTTKRNGKEKCRIVVLGNRIDPTDFQDRSAPVVARHLVKVLVSIYCAAIRKSKLEEALYGESISKIPKIASIDLTNAYLTAPRKGKPIYIKIPYGFPNAGGYAILKKALYGAYESGREFYEHFTAHLEALGFVACPHEPCMRMKVQGDSYLIIITYVDDVMMVGTDDMIVELHQGLKSRGFDASIEYNMEDFLGAEFDYTSEHIKIHRSSFVAKMLERFEHLIPAKGKKRIDVPMTEEGGAFDEERDEPAPPNFPYREIVGCLMWLVDVRPDLAYVSRELSRRNEKHGLKHCRMAIRVLQYLRDNPDKGLHYSLSPRISQLPSVIYPKQAKIVPDDHNATRISYLDHPILPSLLLYGYVDASYGNQPDTLRSGLGAVFFMSGGYIDSTISVTKCTVPSVAEAEFIAMSDASSDFLGLRHIMSDLGYNVRRPVLYSDSSAAITSVLSKTATKMVRHIHIRFLTVRDRITQERDFEISHIAGKENYADAFTKLITNGSDFRRSMNNIMGGGDFNGMSVRANDSQ